MDTSPGEERIAQLLERANQLAEQGLELQRQADARQAGVFEKIETNLKMAREINERASRVNEQAMGVSRLGRKILLTMIPVLALLIGYVSYLLFFRINP